MAQSFDEKAIDAACDGMLASFKGLIASAEVPAVTANEKAAVVDATAGTARLEARQQQLVHAADKLHKLVAVCRETLAACEEKSAPAAAAAQAGTVKPEPA